MHITPRLFLPLVFTAMLAVLGAVYLIGGEAALRPFASFYLIHYDLPPFGDAYGITSAMVCERQGIETYLGNPCHYKPGLVFVYPPIWKLLSLLPMQVSWTTPMALGFMAAFGVSLNFVPPFGSRTGRMLGALALLSPATLMAVDYGNNDMLIFAVVVAGIVSLGRRQVLGYGLLLFAGLLKFFPFAGLGWMVRERLRSVISIGMGIAVLLLGLAWLAGDQLLLSLPVIATYSAGSYVFGIKSLGVAAMEMGLVGPGGATVIRLAFSLVLVIVAWRISARYLAANVQGTLPIDEWRFLIIGCLLVVGAYLTTQSLVYRAIFLLLVLPGLDALRKVPGEKFGQAAAIGVLTMFLFPLRYHLQNLFAPGSMAEFVVTLGTILLREALWFAFAATLLALILTHLRGGAAWQDLTRRWPRERSS